MFAEAWPGSDWLLLGCFLNKEQTVMLELVHGELLIEMGDNGYCKSNEGYFCHCIFYARASSIPSIKLHSGHEPLLALHFT